MSGRIEIIFRWGFSKQFKFNWYPYWGLRVYAEKNGGHDLDNYVDVFPSRTQFKDLIRRIIYWEKKLDFWRSRRDESKEWYNVFHESLEGIDAFVDDLRDYIIKGSFAENEEELRSIIKEFGREGLDTIGKYKTNLLKKEVLA